MINISNLSKVYKQGDTHVTALEKTNIHVDQGKTFAIVGPSGSGKTTLLSLIAGLENPSSGEVTIAGKSVFTLNEKQRADFRAQNIGFVFQQYHLIRHLTALENVSLALEILKKNDAEQTASKLLEKVGLLDRMNHLPGELSGGECQRVAIARAFVNHPPIILADEPSGNLDTKTGDKVMDLLFDLIAQHQMTLVLVTHDHSLARRCDQVIEMHKG